jgi:hypothetical protein
MEWKPGVGRQPASAGAEAQETPPHRCFALARAEFDFRYSHREKLGVNDTARASLALKSAKGRHLTYETTY